MHTLNGDKGKNAKICVQIDSFKLLTKAIKVNGYKEPILYEGLNKSYFGCDKISYQKAFYSVSLEVALLVNK